MTRSRLCLALLLPLSGAVLAGCGGGGDYPALVPMQDILQDDAQVDPDPAPELQARAAALGARADALRRAEP
ncbi:hypothetical protein D2T29_01835 [Sinirhodobacter populi]|uniref:Argininosuccinate lyase n=1 Tax=Paenirhodobacter populi TaxID=2306993 RepID=A0A443KQQ0_9RHOB|nr:hypothetical protein [Sinirhodobacter populi]RWR35232.1 hypothetical protein D2T29_01835 [Sinirhodobacter populi]